MVRILIGYDLADVNARDDSEDGWTPLLCASAVRHIKDGSVLRLLLEHGADINAQSESGRTALHWGSINGAVEVVRLLLEYGADVEPKANDGKAALEYAGEEGHDEVVKLLREHEANKKHLVAFCTRLLRYTYPVSCP